MRIGAVGGTKSAGGGGVGVGDGVTNSPIVTLTSVDPLASART